MRKISRFISLLLVFTIGFAIPVMAETIDNVPVTEKHDEEGNDVNNPLGECSISYTEDTDVAVEGDNGSSTFHIDEVSSATADVFRDTADIHIDAVLGGSSAPGTDDGTNEYLIDMSNGWVITAIFGAIEGLPSDVSGSLSTIYKNGSTWHARGSFMIPFFTNTSTQSCETYVAEERVERPATEEAQKKWEINETVQQEEIRTELTQIAELLPLATPEVKQQIMNTGLNVNMSMVTTVDPSTVKALVSNNTVPYNIIYSYQGQLFTARVPANFDFTPFIQADGSINLSQLLGYLIQENAKAEASKAAAASRTRTRNRRR